MNPAFFLIAALLLALPSQYNLPTKTQKLRNTFVTAAETVIDDAGMIDVKADDASFAPQLQSLKTAKDNLKNLAESDREQEIASEASDLVFAVSACHLQAKDGTPTDACQAQVGRARVRMMENINKHKINGAWVDGPPTA
ncbi:MAG TPA: hypothetical protein VGN16_12885 [Acidobacteriaceae bacterium]|jgi:hypothetical protein